jgi:hypothetical protein
VGSVTVLAPSGQTWRVFVASSVDAPPAMPDPEPWDRAMAGAPVDYFALPAYLSIGATRWIRGRLMLLGLRGTPGRWSVYAVDDESEIRWVWRCRDHRTRNVVIDMLSKGIAPPDLVVEEGSRAFRDDIPND